MAEIERYFSQESKNQKIKHRRGHSALGPDFTKCGKTVGVRVPKSFSFARDCILCENEAQAQDADGRFVKKLDEQHNQPMYTLSTEPPLTRREQFAMSALQGLLSRGIPVSDENIIGLSVRMADALLAELAKPA